jgi:hypothetical protein
MGRACGTNWEKRNAYRIVGNLEGKRPLGGRRRSWVNNLPDGSWREKMWW